MVAIHIMALYKQFETNVSPCPRQSLFGLAATFNKIFYVYVVCTFLRALLKAGANSIASAIANEIRFQRGN